MKKIKSSIVAFFERTRNYKYASLIIALLFAFATFAQCVLFQWSLTGTIILSSLWRAPLEFMAYYLPKLAISLFFASFVLLFRRKYWTIYFSILVNVWIFAEVIYFRAFGNLLDSYSMTMAGNMEVFWDSIFMYVETKDFLVFVPTLLTALAILIFDNRKRSSWIPIASMLIVSVLFSVLGSLSFRTAYRGSLKEDDEFVQLNKNDISYSEYHFNPFTERAFYYMYDVANRQVTCEKYIRYTSVIHHFIYNVKDLVLNGCGRYEMKEKEIAFVNDNLFRDSGDIHPNGGLIIVLVESFENWVIRPDIMPNFSQFIDRHENIFWATKLTKQTKAGNSADGQMIVNTGLLPLNEGAACFRFPYNTYPSLSECYRDTSCAVIVPHELSVWNQDKMSKAYCIGQCVQTGGTDEDVLATLSRIADDYEYILAITISTHNPFEGYHKSTLRTAEGMPDHMEKYIKANNYLDASMADFLSMVDTNEKLKNSTIVFTGDHTIFYPEQRAGYSEFAKKNGLDYEVLEGYFHWLFIRHLLRIR